MTSALPFGHLTSGEPVERLVLARPDGLTVEILTYGAIIRSLKVPCNGRPVETVIGFDTLAAYEADRSYQGCIVGRTVNRLRAGRFSRDGKVWQVTKNEGLNHLHGGALGLSRRIWRAAARPSEAAPVILRYVSPAGEEGYPGTLHGEVTFSLPDAETLQIAYRAEVDAPCPVDLTHHLYFNLGQDCGDDSLDQWLGIPGDTIVEVDAACLSTGVCLPVDGTLFDLRQPQPLASVVVKRHSQLTDIGLNQSWVLNGGVAPAATLSATRTGIALDLYTDQSCLQVYAGLPRDIVPGGAVALEPQGFIDAVNQPAFPSPWLMPGQVYRRTSRYRFRPVSA